MTDSTALAVRPMTPNDWAVIKEQAITLEAAGKDSGILPRGVTNRYQISAILMKGFELGLSPMYALEQISIVSGKPVVQSQALVAIIQRAHGSSAIKVFETTDERAVIGFKRRDEADYQTMEWTIQMAETADLIKKGGPWKQYPRTMLRWRCVAEGARIYMADTIAGLYLPDELGVPIQVDTTGNLVIDAEAIETPAVAPQTIEQAAEEPPTFEEMVAHAETAGQDAHRTEIPKASPYKSASANQLATISKLSRLLGEPEEPDESMTSAEASERITVLAREYNSRKTAEGRTGMRFAREAESATSPSSEPLSANQLFTQRLGVLQGLKGTDANGVLTEVGQKAGVKLQGFTRMPKSDQQTVLNWMQAEIDRLESADTPEPQPIEEAAVTAEQATF